MNRSGPEKAYGLLRVEAELAHSLSGLTGGSEVTLAPYCICIYHTQTQWDATAAVLIKGLWDLKCVVKNRRS